MENQQLSQILQQSLSPVHAAVQVPQPVVHQMPPPPPMYMYSPPNVSMFSQPAGPPSPHYNEQYNMGSAVINHARRAYTQAAMMQDIRQQSPLAWAEDQGMQMAVDPISKRLAAAEETAIRGSSSYGFGGVPLVGGFQSGLNTLAAGASFLPGVGFLGSIGLGMAANTVGGAMDRAVFGGARDLRQAGLMLRGSLNVANLGNSFGMDETGIMRHDVAQNITNQVSMLSQQDTRFSSKQFLQMTDRMANLGMLQGAGSSDEIVNRVKTVSRQLKTFMKVANEPDVLAALQQMAELRNMGVADANLTQAASNARAFARMAGVSRQAMHGAGQQGAQVFQQQGLSEAAGYQTGMLTRGLAGQNLNLFSRGLQQMMGGSQGIANAMSRGIAGAQRHTTMDMLMHTIFQSKGGGQFGLDTRALDQIMQGGDLASLFDSKTRSLNASGDLMQHIQDMNERKPELRQALQQRLGASGMMLLTLRQAQAMQKASGGNMTLNTALMRVTGGDAMAARSIARVATSPQATQQLVENMRHEQRRRALAQQDEIQYQASFGARFGRGFRSMTDFGFSRFVSNFNARRQQEIRDMAMGVYGRDHDADRLLSMNDTQRRDVMRSIFSGRGPTARTGLGAVDETTGVPSFTVSPWNNLTGYGVQSRIAHQFAGYEGFTGRARRFLSGVARGQYGGVGGAMAGSVLTGGLSVVTGLLGTDLDTLSNKELVRRAMETGEIARGALQSGDPQSLTGAAQAVSTASDAFFKGTNISSAGRSSIFSAATKALGATFKGRKGFIDDAKIDFESTKQAIIEQLKSQGMSEADAQRRLNSPEGKKYLQSLLKSRLATRSGSDYTRERAMLGDQFKLSGQTFGKQQNALLDAISGASNTTREGVLGYFSNIQLDREETSQLVGMLGASGAGTKEEMREATKIARLLAQREQGALKEDDFQNAVQGLLAGKDDKQREKILSMMGTMEKKFASLGQKGDISKVLAQKSFDTDKFADVVTKNLKGIQSIGMQRQLSRRLKEDFGIEIGEDKHVGQELLKRAEDSSFIRDLKKKGGRSEQLASLLQNVREGEKGSKEALGEFIAGKGQLRTGLSTIGGASDAVAQRQMAMIQGLHSFASQNARNTAAMGTTVDRMAALIGKSDSGASLGSVVNDFKNAVDKFAAARGAFGK